MQSKILSVSILLALEVITSTSFSLGIHPASSSSSSASAPSSSTFHSNRHHVVKPFGVAAMEETCSSFSSSSRTKSSTLLSVIESDTTMGESTDTSSPSTSSSAQENNEKVPSNDPKLRRNKFESSVYDKPIVLIGCRGAGDELNRLAASYVSKSTGIESAAQRILENMQMEESGGDMKRSDKKHSIIPTVGTDGKGTWVLTQKDLQPIIEKKVLDRTNVIVLDFDAPAFNVDEGKNGKKLTTHLSDLAKSLYEDEELLVVYVNVHHEEGGMSRNGRSRKEALEQDVFIKYSDYELCIKNEGLDVMTIMAQRVLSEQTNGSADASAATDDDNDDDEVELAMKSSDPFTSLLTVDSEEKQKLLDSIAEEQLSNWDTTEWQFRRLLARAFLPPAIPGSMEPNVNTAHLTFGQNAFFLSLSFPDVDETKPYIEAMCQDVDAMEFRADLLDCRDDRFEVLYSLQKVRSMCQPHAVRAPMLPYLGGVIDDSLPVVYTVRTAHQAGTYPDDSEGIAKMFDLLDVGLRAGVEVLDVESAWDKKKQDELLNKVEDHYSTQVLGSHHMVGEQVSTEEAVTLFRQCELDGRAHGAKVVLSIDDSSADHQAFEASAIAHLLEEKEGKPVIPHIGLILGDQGQYSRVLNLAFTPVTHESLPFVAAPGQMSASELMTTRLLMNIITPMKYGILGHNIAYSVSPAMQGAAFKTASLPHQYALIDMESVDEFVNSDLWNDDVFGGCSVTIPHKQTIIPHLDTLTDAAQSIGAVNTVIVEHPQGSDKRVLVGDNTDWRGIFSPLKRKLSTSVDSDVKDVALILGGGGTARAAAYAANELGLEIIYYNRTPSKAEELAERFGGTVVASLDGDEKDPILEKFNLDNGGEEKEGDDGNSLGSVLRTMNGEVRVVISTLPAAAEFELPEWFVKVGKESQNKPIVFDVNYKPYWTKLLYQAENVGFQIVRGSEMLWEQGVGQFELWTGRTAPYKVMKEVVLKNCLPEEEDK